MYDLTPRVVTAAEAIWRREIPTFLLLLRARGNVICTNAPKKWKILDYVLPLLGGRNKY
jgi:hypothetical protein